MSLQWTLVAGFLYLEVALLLLLLLPFISAKKWHSLFKSRFFKALEGQAVFYYYVLLLLLVLLFLDAVREMRKYRDDFSGGESTHTHLDLEIQNHMRLFRAQRNFYISGFALFLSLVLRRIISLITRQALLEAGSEAALRQALSASEAAKKMMSGVAPGVTERDVKELRATVAALERERDAAQKRCQAMQQQAEATNREYDRLTDEHARLQRQQQQQLSADNSPADKKSD